MIGKLSAGALLLAGTAAMAEVPRVATDIAPVHGLVARVMQGLGTPELVVPQGASPHGYAMRASEAQSLDDADIVFWVGEALTPWLADPLGTIARDARSVELLALPETAVLDSREEAVFEAGAAEDAHDHEDHAEHDHGDHDHEAHAEHDHEAHAGHGHEDHGHAHGGTDPHAWLDPDNARTWLSVIAASLSDLDPENADTYRANAEAGVAEIDAAEDRAAEALSGATDRPFVVFHDAYQYFEAHFGLPAAGAISVSDASDPSPRRVAEIRDAVVDRGITCVFAEPQFNPGLVTAIAGDGLSSAVIDPLGARIEPGPGFYPALIEKIADTIATCG
ncbi:zinc ABC transporter substrate-binding protein [Roseivivax isoporae]|uniref:High-affinity zinc uptake system protein ZnuA n=1 Tax=Roseivivax isoporae LMG 25204 TaxID=1449351 RepID=X7F7H7_9RHOB|nr:zinc ABC transporter substrate-binding protein [Roseivivax isoporae]ETX28683.1 zinc transporter [Roseivivax isoporae LMG 25204]